MEFDLQLQQRHVVRLVVGVPEHGEGLRARLETHAGDVVTLEESTLTALVRAYMTVSTHPRMQAIELRSTPMAGGGYGDHQLMETQADEAALRRDLVGLARAGELDDLDLEPEGDGDSDDDLQLDDAEEERPFGVEPTAHSAPSHANDEHRS